MWKRGRLHRETPLAQERVDFEFPKTCAHNDWKKKIKKGIKSERKVGKKNKLWQNN